MFEQSIAKTRRAPNGPSGWRRCISHGDDVQARRWTARSLELAPEHLSVIVAAFLELLTGHPDTALEHTRKSLNIDPTFAGALTLSHRRYPPR